MESIEFTKTIRALSKELDKRITSGDHPKGRGIYATNPQVRALRSLTAQLQSAFGMFAMIDMDEDD